MAGYNDSEGPYTQGAPGAGTHLTHITDITNKFDKDATPASGDTLEWNGTVYAPRGAVAADIRRHGATTALTDNAAALTAACAASTEVLIPAGTWNFTTSPTIPSSTKLTFAKGARFVWNGTGDFITLSGLLQIKFEGGRISLTAAGQTAFMVSNSFRCSWIQCIVDGLHTGASGSTYHTQVGFEFRSNAGDNRIIDCDLNNLGEAIQADCIMNYLIGSVVGACWTGFHGDAGSFGAGLIIDDCTFQGSSIGAAAVRAHVLIDVAANQTMITNSWFEGCTTAIQAGTNSGTPGGPTLMVIQNVKLAATTKCLDIQAGRQFRLDSIRFSADPSATPTELTIDATNAADGFASNLASTTSFDIARTVFPGSWTYLPRQTSDTQFAGASAYLGGHIGAGTPSFYHSGNGRARVGYDGSGTVLSDAGGGRDVVLRSGATPQNLVTADSTGVLHLGQKASSNNSMVKGVFIAQATTVPTGNPAGGGYLYVESGALKYRGTSGTITTLGPA